MRRVKQSIFGQIRASSPSLPPPSSLSLSQGQEGTVEKHSESLGRNAQYKKSSKLSRLPGYLTIQLVRFFVGKAGDSEEIVSKKILKVIGEYTELGLCIIYTVLSCIVWVRIILCGYYLPINS